MSDSKSSPAGGIGFFGLLTIVFITLKLTGHIDWSWWLVLSPLLAPIVIIFFVLLAFFIMIDRKKSSRKQ